MNIIDIELESWSTFVLMFNWIAVVITLILLWRISFLMKKCLNYANQKSVTVDEVIMKRLKRIKRSIYPMKLSSR